MTFLDLAKNRYSVRAYKKDPVEKEKLDRILEAAQIAPTACNLQPFVLMVIHTQGREKELQEIYQRPWFTQAPLLICACGIPGNNWIRRDGKNYNDVDVAIVLDHLILAAADEGLGSCWVAAFDHSAAKRVLGLPSEVEPVAFTPIGYAADQPSSKKRKPIGELVRYERWS